MASTPSPVVLVSGRQTGATDRFVAVVKGSDVDDLAVGDREDLPSLDVVADLVCRGSTHDAQADQNLVAVGEDFGHTGADPGVTSSPVPSQYLPSVLAAWFGVVWSAPLDIRV